MSNVDLEISQRTDFEAVRAEGSFIINSGEVRVRYGFNGECISQPINLQTGAFRSEGGVLLGKVAQPYLFELRKILDERNSAGRSEDRNRIPQ